MKEGFCYSPNGYISGQPEVFWLEDFICARVVQNSLGMDTGLVCECAITAMEEQDWVVQSWGDRVEETYVIGFMNGMFTSTASATKFSISRSIGRLYLALTYSGFAAYKQAISPPRGVMPTRSPMPNTAIQRGLSFIWVSYKQIGLQVSIWVAPASSAV